jgi:hypothetical protein
VLDEPSDERAHPVEQDEAVRYYGPDEAVDAAAGVAEGSDEARNMRWGRRVRRGVHRGWSMSARSVARKVFNGIVHSAKLHFDDKRD